jgi:hypothetical protein
MNMQSACHYRCPDHGREGRKQRELAPIEASVAICAGARCARITQCGAARKFCAFLFHFRRFASRNAPLEHGESPHFLDIVWLPDPTPWRFGTVFDWKEA